MPATQGYPLRRGRTMKTRVRQSCTFLINSHSTRSHRQRQTPIRRDPCYVWTIKHSWLEQGPRLRKTAGSSKHTRRAFAYASLPADRFGGCYQVPHWALPPLKVMSLMANRTFDTVLNHFSFLHGPTFKLIDTAACLAFAICTVGGIQSGKHKYDYLLDRVDAVSHSSKSSGLDGPVPPGSTWESMYRNNFSPGGLDHDDVEQVAMWQNGHIVRAEKTNMLVKVGTHGHPR